MAESAERHGITLDIFFFPPAHPIHFLFFSLAYFLRRVCVDPSPSLDKTQTGVTKQALLPPSPLW